MTEVNGDVQVRPKSVDITLGGLSFVIGVCLSAHAAAGPSHTQGSELPILVSAGNTLSEGAIEKQTGTGLHPPALTNDDQGAGPRIQLWDELRVGPLMAPVTGGIIAGGPTK